jgi:hypothetical protein
MTKRQQILDSIDQQIGQIEKLVNEIKANYKSLEGDLEQANTQPAEKTTGTKVVGKVELGNIEQCFMEEEIREIEEDWFDGY